MTAIVLRLPDDAVLELPLAGAICPLCGTYVMPYEQATSLSYCGDVMQTTHYICDCGCKWGRSHPRRGH